MPIPHPTIFISYSHDSEAHRDRVLRLSERLRDDGIETRLDQYVNGTPVQGWPRWMLDRLDEADFVLVICTETYYWRFRGHEVPGKGKGVDWEGALITQEIYDAHSKTLKFVPVLFVPEDEPFTPEALRALTRYVLNSEENYQALYDFLLGQAGVQPGPVGALKPKHRQQGAPLRFDEHPAPDEPHTASTVSPTCFDGRRRLDAAAPSRAALGDTIDVLVQERPLDSPPLGIKDWPFKENPASLETDSKQVIVPFAVDPKTGRVAPAKLRIRVVAPDFMVHDPQEKILDVPPRGASEILSFLLTTGRRGMCRINVEVSSIDREYVGTVPVATLVNGASQTQQPTIASLVLMIVVPEHSITQQTSEKKHRSALEIWYEKLNYLLAQEAISAEPAQKFALMHQIQEARAKIAEFETAQKGQIPLTRVNPLIGPSVSSGAASVGQLQTAPPSQTIAAPDAQHDKGCLFRHVPAQLFGREKDLADLDAAWINPKAHVLSIVAWGGIGKTSLVANWMASRDVWNNPEFDRVFDWSFYSQGTREQGAASADTFIDAALEFFGREQGKKLANSPASPWDKGAKLAEYVRQKPSLLVLDGLEPLQHPPGPFAGRLRDPALEAMLRGLAQRNPGLCLVTTRERVADLAPFRDTTAPVLELTFWRSM